MTVLLVDGNSILFRAYYATAGIPDAALCKPRTVLYQRALRFCGDVD